MGLMDLFGPELVVALSDMASAGLKARSYTCIAGRRGQVKLFRNVPTAIMANRRVNGRF